jgi:uncharacterized membrane protein YfcA
MLILLIELYVLGMLAGTLSGLLGIGGGLVVVPGLLYLFAHNVSMPNDALMHMAVGTSLAVMIVTTLRSLLSHLKRDVEFWSIYKPIMPGVIIGTILGALLAHYLQSRSLEIVFAVFILILSIRLLFPAKVNSLRKLPGNRALSVFGLLVGAKSGLLGVGGGALTIPFLTHSNVNIRQAVVVSAATGLTVACIGTVCFILNGWWAVGLPAWSTGYIYWPAWLPMVLGSIVFAPLGTRLPHHLPAPLLKRFFGVFLVLVAIRMLLS